MKRHLGRVLKWRTCTILNQHRLGLLNARHWFKSFYFVNPSIRGTTKQLFQ